MELAQAKGNLIARRAGTKVAGGLVMLAKVSLGIGIVSIPWRLALMIEARPQPPVYKSYTNLMLYLSEIPLVLTVLLWLLSLTFKQHRITIKPAALTLALGGLVLISALSSFSSADRPVSLADSARLLLYFGLYLYLINEVHDLTWLWIPSAVSILIQSGVAFGQALMQHSVGLQALQEINLNPSASGVSIVLAGGMRLLRVYGLTDHPNILGGCLAFSLLLMMTGFLETSGAKRWLIGGVFITGSIALLLTFSRSAWLGLAAGLGLVGLYLAAAQDRRSFKAWFGLVGVTLLLLAPLIWNYAPYLSSRLNLDGSFSAATPENQSINERWLLLAQSEKITALHPLSGVGVGAYPQAFHATAPTYPFDYQPPHLVLAEVAAETGLPGAFLYLFILLVPWVLLIRSRKLTRLSVQLTGMTALVLAASVISFLDYYPWLSNAGSAWQWLIWGLWGSSAMIVFKGGKAA